jgi:hypothetical protein
MSLIDPQQPHQASFSTSARADPQTVGAMNEWELWLLAAKMIRDHNDNAANVVREEIRKSEDLSNMTKALEWKAIEDRVASLSISSFQWRS